MQEREDSESFTDFVGRLGKAEVKRFLQDLTAVPAYAEDPSFYSDWGDPREYSMEDYGEGECAGECQLESLGEPCACGSELPAS